MSVQITIEDHKHHHHRQTQQVMLRMGAWVNGFPNNQYKWMVAQALNACVHIHGEGSTNTFQADIPGYVIYEKDVYLVLHIQQKEIPHLLHFFSGVLKMEIIAELNRVIRLTNNSAAKRALRRLNTTHVKLYRQYPFTSFQLADMITGKPVSDPFDTPQFKRLQNMVHGNLFCSAIDYSGGKSPVIVQKKRRLVD